MVISETYGGFGLSEEAKEMYRRLKNLPRTDDCEYPSRSCPVLIEVVETLGTEKASANYSYLVVKDIPIPSKYMTLSQYDGLESVYPAVSVDLYHGLINEFEGDVDKTNSVMDILINLRHNKTVDTLKENIQTLHKLVSTME